ncbi:HepT-like ribonuclease domain-containing protein [Trichloromonas sp.]|uniref:HepT-like ribonuclease domain-containing protein n=1 Tax=Trichloromonas sp. TaxID=3069249 RepID=UPI003D81392C
MTETGRDQIYVAHMLECIQRVERYVGTDKDQFLTNTLLQDAVMRVLQVMAESGQRLSSDIKSTQNQIDWRAIAGFRNILVHDYLGGIDLELIWVTVQQDLPVLKNALLKMSA